mmetsp:Transcript_25630/g.76460  ORF Transcript_25630/g.76460 Transcript_25630/m.76460 type:complete len:228 (+) Transcript_25630:226-909(+)
MPKGRSCGRLSRKGLSRSRNKPDSSRTLTKPSRSLSSAWKTRPAKSSAFPWVAKRQAATNSVKPSPALWSRSAERRTASTSTLDAGSHHHLKSSMLPRASSRSSSEMRPSPSLSAPRNACPIACMFGLPTRAAMLSRPHRTMDGALAKPDRLRAMSLGNFRHGGRLAWSQGCLSASLALGRRRGSTCSRLWTKALAPALLAAHAAAAGASKRPSSSAKPRHLPIVCS